MASKKSSKRKITTSDQDTRGIAEILREKERECVRLLAHTHGFTATEIALVTPFTLPTIRRWIRR